MSPRTAAQLEENRKATEQQILTAALKIFSIHGYAGASIRIIAKEARISNGLLYNYFKSKEELVFAVMKSSFKTLDTTIVYEKAETPEANFKNSVCNFFELISAEKEKVRLLAQMGLHGKKFDLLNDATISKYQQSVSKFESIFKEMGLSNPKLEARILVVTLDGVMFETLLMGQPFNIEKFKNELIQKYFR